MRLIAKYFASTTRRLCAEGVTKLAKSSNGVKVQPFEQLPEAKGIPVIGTLLDYTKFRGFDTRFISKLWERRHETYGDIFKENVPGFGCIVFCRSPADTKAMVSADSLIRTPYRPQLDTLKFIKKAAGLPETLSNLNGQEWYQFRKVINKPLLSNKMVWKYIDKQHGVAREMVEYIARNLNDHNEVEDFDSVLGRWAFEMSGIFLLNKKMGLLQVSPSTEMDEMFKAQTATLEFISNAIGGRNLWKYFPTKERRDLTSRIVRSEKILSKILVEKQGSEDTKGTVLDYVLEAEELSKPQRKSLVQDLIGASVETTSKAFALVMYCLSQHPCEQERLREEILSLPESVTGRMLDGMVYMNVFIKETVRLFPFAHSFMRFYNEEIILSGYRIPSGTKILNTANSTLNKDTNYFPDPNDFLPERWMREAKDAENRFNLTGPFGQGPRACPGRRFAMQEIRLLLIEMLKKYRIEYHHKPIVSAFRTTGSPSESPQFTFFPLNPK